MMKKQKRFQQISMKKKTVLLTIALLIAVIIYCYLIKYRAKQKHLLPFHVTSSKLKEIIF